MNPANTDQIVFLQVVEQMILVVSGACVLGAALWRNHQVRNVEVA